MPKEELKPGDLVEASVTRLEPYGAWIECEGQAGLVLIPDISWSRIGHPAEALTVGQRVQVKVLVVPPDKRFSASIRHVHPELDPWHDPTPFAPGREFVGPITMITDYGCFVELRPGVWGLVHRDRWQGEMTLGKRLRVRVEHADPESRKVEVSVLGEPAA